MKFFSILLISSLFTTTFFAQNPSHEWSGSFGSDSSDVGQAITTDPQNNVYTAGSCIGIIDFDITSGVYSLGPAAGNTNEQDIYITKSNASGNLLWAKRIGDTTTVFGTNIIRNGARDIKVDASGNVFILGYYRGIVDFDPGPGVFSLNSMNSGGNAWKTFLLKLDTSGNFSWVKEFVGSYFGFGMSLVMDAATNIYINGYFNGLIDLDPGPSSYTAGTMTTDSYIVKLDASGNFLMGKQITSTNSNSHIYESSLALDLAGNIYAVGFYDGVVDFDPGVGSFTLNAGAGFVSRKFVLKLDGIGNFVWVKEYANNYSSAVIVMDASSIYITGTFEDTVDFDPGPAVYNLVATGNNGVQSINFDQFILKLDLNGNFVWAKSIASVGTSYGSDIALDTGSNVYVSGYFATAADLNPGNGVHYLAGNGGFDGFILKLDTLGNYVWAKTIAGMEDDYLGELAISNGSDIHATGYFGANIDADPGNTVVNLTSLGKRDAFILKWSQCSAASSPTDITTPQNKLICANTSASLSAICNNQIAWYGSPTGTLLTLGTGSNYVSPPLGAGSYIFYAGDQQCADIGRTAIAITVDACTGLNEITGNTLVGFFEVYPVPTSTGFVSLVVKQYSEDLNLKVYTTLGELIMSQNVLSSKMDLDLSRMPQGVYLAELSKAGKPLQAKKIIKQ